MLYSYEFTDLNHRAKIGMSASTGMRALICLPLHAVAAGSRVRVGHQLMGFETTPAVIKGKATLLYKHAG